MFFASEPFEFPEALSEILEKFKAKPEALAKLWPILAKQRGLTAEGEQHYGTQGSLAEAYAAYYLPANALKIYFILEEMRRLGMPFEKNLRVVDFGSGPGSALCGLGLWAKENSARIQYRAWEQSHRFLEQGEKLAREMRNIFPMEANFSISKKPPLDFVKSTEPHIVLWQNSVHEIFPDKSARKQELERILSLLKRLGGPRYLILIEPALRDSTRDLLELRKELIDGGRSRVWLPCLDNRPCGALASPGDWCHEAIPVNFPAWFNELGSEAGMKKEALLFSYLVLSHRDLEIPGWRQAGYRMVSQRLERKGQTECYLCSQNGKIKVRVQHSKTTEENKQLHSWVRGDLFSEVEIGEFGDLKLAHLLVDRDTKDT